MGPVKKDGNDCLGNSFCSNPGGGGILTRHLETANMLYCDGHVKALRIGDIATVSTVQGQTSSDPAKFPYKYFTPRED